MESQASSSFSQNFITGPDSEADESSQQLHEMAFDVYIYPSSEWIYCQIYQTNILLRTFFF
jgi:hypothetical protein